MNPFKKRSTTPHTPGVILDTCALIDGRVVAIAKAGFVPSKVFIPQFVIAELQFLADHGDTQKRERARFGLDIVRELQDVSKLDVVIAREQFKNIKEVDDKLIALAKQYGSPLYTTDYNLNKVAQIEGVKVLNVNELAQALRPPRLPGEQIELKITQLGQDKTQGVSFLDDGTMVVVEQAGRFVGQRVKVQFSRILQTQAGKMMFAILIDRPHDQHPRIETSRQVSHVPQVYHAVPQQKPVQQSVVHRKVTHTHNHTKPPKPQVMQHPQQVVVKPPQAKTIARQPQPQVRKQAPRRRDIEDSLLDAVRQQQ